MHIIACLNKTRVDWFLLDCADISEHFFLQFWSKKKLSDFTFIFQSIACLFPATLSYIECYSKILSMQNWAGLKAKDYQSDF